jgi:hypothetical protein
MGQIFVGLIAEGKTDGRFLEPIIEKVLTEIAFESMGQIDISIKIFFPEKGDNFIDFVSNASKMGHQELGISMLIIHADADDKNADATYDHKIKPALSFLSMQSEDTHCKFVAALVPIQEVESWMLADKQILIKQIGTKKSEVELNINGHPESFTDPKSRIEEAIRIGRADLPKKLRNALQISDLYSFLGQSIQIEKLRVFDSFKDFESNVRRVLVDLNYLSGF